MVPFLRVGTVVLLVTVGSFAAHAVIATSSGISGFNTLAGAIPLVSSVTTAVAMLLGIFGNAVWERLGRQSTDEVDLMAVLRSTLQTAALVRAAIVSPIVFIVVYGLVKDEPDPIVAHLLAFQNGFFWESVFSKKEP